ncbi:hypothetical protein QQZ08_009388 [Neonectria magnoliae]|uniref:Chromo domain-containing protein n=1 Tax=Neonectria magnoliae TaxID=2732573 RepID=A0ABR1HPW0_9HYPO
MPQSPDQLWIHLEDVHSIFREPTKKRKSESEDGQGDDENSSPTKKLRAQFQVGGDQTYDGFWKSGAYHVSVGWISSDVKVIPEVPTKRSTSSSPGIDEPDHVWDEQDCIPSSDTPPSSLCVSSANTVYSNQGDDMSLRSGSLLTAPEGNEDVALWPVSSSDGLNPTPQEHDPSNCPSTPPHNNSNLASFEDHISERNPGLLQPALVIRTEKPEASATRGHEHRYSEGRRASEKLQAMLSLSENPDMIDPQLFVDQHSQEHLKSTEGGTSSSTQSYLQGAQAGQPIALDADEDIWEVDRLLAKWTQGRQALYLVKWNGFSDNANSWQRRDDINDELVSKFDASFSDDGGNHEGVELLKKRMRRGKTEYLVRWKGRPLGDNSWEKESTISRRRVQEFATSGRSLN